MHLTGLDLFDASIHRTLSWLQDLMRELNWTDRRKACLALMCVLQGLRDHLPVEQAVSLGNQFPLLIRGLYFENWDPSDKPLPWNSREDLTAGICSLSDRENMSEAEPIVLAVFRLLEKKAVDGEIQNLRDLLPTDIRELWPTPLRAA